MDALPPSSPSSPSSPAPKPWKRLLLLLAILLPLTLGMGWVLGQQSADREARAHLDQLLGQQKPLPQVPEQRPEYAPPLPRGHDPFEAIERELDQMAEDLAQGGLEPISPSEVPPAAPPAEVPRPRGGLLDGLVGKIVQGLQLDVKETEQAYILNIPINQAEEAKNITVTVRPHSVQVAGNTPMTSPDGQTHLGTSSFVRSFTTDDTLDPNRVRRRVVPGPKGRSAMLEVTIPKVADAPSRNPGPAQPPVQMAPQPGRIEGQTGPEEYI